MGTQLILMLLLFHDVFVPSKFIFFVFHSFQELFSMQYYYFGKAFFFKENVFSILTTVGR